MSDLKHCLGCKETKPVTEFHGCRSCTDGLQARCKGCAKASRAAYHAADPGKTRATNAAYRAANRGKRRATTAARRKARRRFINSIKTKAGCADCGYDIAAGLDFDHVRGEKSFGIGRDVTRPLPVLLAEIEKCEVRCKSCHMARHSAERVA